MTRHVLANGIVYYDQGDSVLWAADMNANLAALDKLVGQKMVSVADYGPGGNPSTWSVTDQRTAILTAVATNAPNIYIPEMDSNKVQMTWSTDQEIVLTTAGQQLYNPNRYDPSSVGGCFIKATAAMRSVVRLNGARTGIVGVQCLGGTGAGLATSGVEVVGDSTFMAHCSANTGTSYGLLVTGHAGRYLDVQAKASSSANSVAAVFATVDATVDSCFFQQGTVTVIAGGSCVFGGANHWTGGPNTATLLWVQGNGSQFDGVHLDNSVATATPYSGTYGTAYPAHLLIQGTGNVFTNLIIDGASGSTGTGPAVLLDSSTGNTLGNQILGVRSELMGTGSGFNSGFTSQRTAGTAPSGPTIVTGASMGACTVLQTPRVAGDFIFRNSGMLVPPNYNPTENSGTNTLSTGARTVTHGLCGTPTVVRVQNTSSANGMYVDTIGATTFAVHGTGSDGFIWKAELN